jgi:hypothetical protein
VEGTYLMPFSSDEQRKAAFANMRGRGGGTRPRVVFPKIPSTPKTPKVPKDPKAPKVPKAPKAPRVTTPPPVHTVPYGNQPIQTDGNFSIAPLTYTLTPAQFQQERYDAGNLWQDYYDILNPKAQEDAYAQYLVDKEKPKASRWTQGIYIDVAGQSAGWIIP